MARIPPSLPDMENPPPLPARSRSIAGMIYDVLSGFGLATILLLLLGLLTWFATLEQIDHGLYPTLNKYFHWKSLFLFPELKFGEGAKEKWVTIPLPLPGGYWVSALLLLNMTLGGVIRIRKGWKHVGNLISHFGIIFLLIGGGVAHHYSERGNMAVGEGQTSDVAEDYFEYVVEITEIKDGKATNIRVIRGDQIDDLTDGGSRIFRLPDLPFDLEVAGYQVHGMPIAVNERAPRNGERVLDGYFLEEMPPNKSAESNTAGCYARVLKRDKSEPVPFILAGASFHPFTYKDGERVFTVDMRKRLWPMPFSVRLDHFTAEFHPGTMKPAKFVSKITRTENGVEAKQTIQMNEPMRYEGLTFFQASYGPQGAMPGQKMFSVFEVVKNPADKWPEYSLYIVSFGMLVTFLIKLVIFILASTRKKRHV
jgi:hypothetical protein